MAGAESARGREGEGVDRGRLFRACGTREGLECYSRGVKFSPAERTSLAALPHKESVFGRLKNISYFFLETEPGRSDSSRAGC